MTHLLQADARALPLADDSVNLTFCSPPYCDARTYGINAQRGCLAWVEWMLEVVTECQRVTTGPVLVVAAGVTRKRNYWPACEGLMWEWWKRGGAHELYRPCFWHRVGIPGSGGKDWLRADVEYVMCFKRPGELAWSDNTACGHPPKWGPGGEMSHRTTGGARVNQWGHGGTGPSCIARNKDGIRTGGVRPSHVFGNQQTTVGRRANGEKKSPYFNGNGFPAMRVTRGTSATGEQLPNRETPFPVKANPGNLLRTNVGGGHLGSKLAHENEAPFPEKLAEFFIKSFCPPGGTVLDQFSGSGTTVSVARRLGRHGIGIDLRMSQCELGRRRLAEPDAPVKAARKCEPVAVAGEPLLFGGAA